jgi:hypothetical protein
LPIGNSPNYLAIDFCSRRAFRRRGVQVRRARQRSEQGLEVFQVVETAGGEEEGTRSWDDISYTGHKAKTGIFCQIMTRATFRPEQNRPDELGRPPGPKKLVLSLIDSYQK